MTDFDPNATPESNVFSEVVKGDAWLCMTAQEKAKRRAFVELERLREQLIIAKHNLLAISQLGTTYDQHVQFANYALQKIEQVGK